MAKNTSGNNKVYWKYNEIIELYCHDSALKLGQMISQYGQSKGYFEIAPRFEDAPEKPKAGERVYDRDSHIFVSLGTQQLARLYDGLTTLCSQITTTANGKTYTPLNNKLSIGICEISVGKGEWLDPPEPNAYYINVRNKDTDFGVGFMFENAPLTFDVQESDEHLIVPSIQNLNIFLRWLNKQYDESLAIHDPAVRPQTQQNYGNPTNNRPTVSNNRFRNRPNTNNSQGANSSAAPYEPQGDDEDMPF